MRALVSRFFSSDEMCSLPYIAQLNNYLSSFSPVAIIAGTIASVLLLQKSAEIYRHWNRQEIEKTVS